jgi:hypothetical protein
MAASAIMEGFTKAAIATRSDFRKSLKTVQKNPQNFVLASGFRKPFMRLLAAFGKLFGTALGFLVKSAESVRGFHRSLLKFSLNNSKYLRNTTT